MGEHSEDDKALPEMNKKRTVKTRAQTEALEKFYNEHKYPPESMKEEVAKSIGLTEKQVSGWFCHRRLKDKRLLNPEAYAHCRQDRSSSIIQDHGSGLRQDSCGSTKQGNDRNFDPREVESRILTGQDFSAVDLTYELGSHYTGNHGHPYDTSPGSSSSLQNMIFAHDRGRFAMASSRYQAQSLSIGIKEVKPRPGPSGYLKVKGLIDNAAVTAVKRQLGRNYQADGPPLGIEFDPLPPGAFETPVQGPSNERYYAEEPVLHCSPEVSTIHKNPNLRTGHQRSLKTSSHDSGMDRTRFRIAHGHDHSQNILQQNYKQKSPLYDHGDFYARRSSSADFHEVSVRKTNDYNSQDINWMADHSVGGMSSDYLSGLHRSRLYEPRINCEHAEPWLPDYKNMNSKVATAEHFDSKPSSLTSKGVECDDFKHKGLSRRMAKETKGSEERLTLNSNFDPVLSKVQPKDGLTTAKRVGNELPQEDHIKKASWSEVQSLTNQVSRSAAEMPTSFSEDDETADTSSSMD